MDSCLVQVTDFTLREMTDVFHTALILVDLQKTFNKLHHIVLLQKMECIDFNESVIKWFRSYPSSRYFFVMLENVFSDDGLVNCGVPQVIYLRTAFLRTIYK